MATVRTWLNSVGFNWQVGIIVHHSVGEDHSPGWGNAVSAEKISAEHQMLDVDFDDGHGGPECPRFFAKDDKAVYFPVQYDGATWIEKVMLDPEYYLDINNPTPYPGG